MKIQMAQGKVTIEERFNEFLAEKQGLGASPKTIETYRNHWHVLSKYLDLSTPVEDLFKRTILQVYTTMAQEGYKDTTINGYSRTMSAFIGWCKSYGYVSFQGVLYKCQETTKETYTDEELALLLEKPNLKRCSFSEYRNWVTINFLLDTGCRASTLRGIRNEDIDLDRGCVIFKTLKNKKNQVNPLSGEMVKILREYIRIRKGEPQDYLFCNSEGEQQTETSLRNTIVRYNHSRGVEKTSIHLFRHTFARKYLIDLGGDPFRLQRLLGHSTLDMCKHYCAIYDKDLLGMKTPLDTVKKPKKIKIS